MIKKLPSRRPEAAIRRRRRVMGIGAFLAMSAFWAASASAADRIVVKLDQAQILQLPPKTSIVVLGNPIIADVTLLKKSNSMILTGKSFGQTNLIALDQQGRTLGQSEVEVVAPSQMMIVQLGTSRQSYSCAPRCQPTFELGDDSQFTGGVTGEIKARNALSQPGAQ